MSLQQLCSYTFWKFRCLRTFLNSLLAQGCEAKASGDRAEVGPVCHADKTRHLLGSHMPHRSPTLNDMLHEFLPSLLRQQIAQSVDRFWPSG